MKLYKQTLFPIFVIIYLFISEILSLHINFFRYSDEIVTVILTIYLLFIFFTKKVYLPKEITRILVMYIAISVIGLVSNYVNGIQENFYVIILGMISFLKLFICSLAFIIIINKEKARAILNFLNKPAKIILILGLVFMCMSQALAIGMRGSKGFGVWGFNFIFGYEHVYSVVILFLILIIYGIENNKNKLFYLIIAMIQMVSTTKGPSIIWAASILFLLIYMKKRNKIKIGIVIALGIVSVFLGSYQITNYFMNENAPRYLFYKYGAVTANRYFPLGAGFSTFGSDMAAENYSKLYDEYGFDGLYGMSRDDKSFLNDNFWPMIYGQFGWIGLILAISIVFNVFKIIQSSKMNGVKKGLVFSVFFYTLLHSLGSSILTSSCSIILYIGIILFIKNNALKEDKINVKKQI